jgi:multiple sugar transport system permease protein
MSKASPDGSMRRGRFVGDAIAHVFLSVACIVVLVPFAYLLSVSLRPFRDILAGRFLVPLDFTSYRALLAGGASFPSLLLNSVVISLAATVACMFIGALGAYGISRFYWSPWIPRTLLGWLVVVQTLPAIAMVGPFYSIGIESGLYNTRTLLVLVYVAINLPLVTWLMIAYYQSVPRELEEAAIVDGASWTHVFFRVVLPLSTPAIAASGVLAFIFSWKEFLLALSLTSTPAAMTLPVGIAGFVQDYNIEYGMMSAAASIAVIPGLLLAAFAQRYIVAGLTSGSVKS